MNLPTAIQTVVDGKDLSYDDMASVMQHIMTGAASAAQIGGFLVGMRMKGETVTEITAAAHIMRQLATNIDITGDHIVDTCGTGGDGAHTFNISTASALVAAAAGAVVAKHGNRSMSSQSGSADVLEKAGVNLMLSASDIKRCIDTIGIGFMFAPNHHGAMKHVMGARRDMAIRTLFNLLGPLTNPARAPHQVIGVFAKKWLTPIAEVLKALGSHHVLVVHADDGLDEISIGSDTHIAELKQGTIRHYTLCPEDFNLSRQSSKQLVVKDAAHSLAVIYDVLAGKKGAARDSVILNAGAAIYVAGLADNLHDGIQQASHHIDNGDARQKLADLVAFSKEV